MMSTGLWLPGLPTCVSKRLDCCVDNRYSLTFARPGAHGFDVDDLVLGRIAAELTSFYTFASGDCYSARWCRGKMC